ncbi:AAA family ATPase [Clostridium sp.]|uniref:AAA family ATPase n=1 Tax=Clostridium sp. TaxID=1506 RepID=UPI002FC660DF
MKSKVKVAYIMHPKTVKTKPGEFCIFTAEVIEHIEGSPKVHEKYGTITLKGTTPSLQRGDEFIVAYGEEETNKFGTSYKLTSICKEIDINDPKQVESYLEFISNKTVARELMKLENPIQLLKDRKDEVLLTIKGIGSATLERIYKNMDSTMDNSYAYGRLLPYGLSKSLINRICQAYGSPQTAVEMCLNNPYDLSMTVKGVSFVTADSIAIKCNLDLTSDDRLRAAIYHILLDSGYNGKTYITTQQLIDSLNNIITVEWGRVTSIIQNMINSGLVFTNKLGTELALTQFVELEKSIAIELVRLMNAPVQITFGPTWEKVVQAIEHEQGWEYTIEQKEGIYEVLNNNVCAISGKAGTGKTTITNAVTKILNNYMIRQVALSAKAAARLKQVTQLDSSTIHKLLGIGFKNENPKVYGDIFIIDESTMINGYLFLTLLKAIPSGCKVILLGDPGQLTSIGEGNVFTDILKSNVIPHVSLTQIHRQAKASAIISKSIDIRNQVPIFEKGFVGHRILGELQDLELFIQDEKEGLLEIVVNNFMEELNKYGGNLLEVQVIVAMKNRGNLSTLNINKEIQSLVNSCIGSHYAHKDGFKIFVGDKVINTKNNYNAKGLDGEKTSLFNGNIGIVTKITDKSIEVDFENVGTIIVENMDRNNLQLSYAITVHSSQGSQWSSVICTFDMGAFIMLNVEILYTAITRASKHCKLIAESKAINYAIRTVDTNTKQTYLDRFLKIIN